jgi:hypothetical protein
MTTPHHKALTLEHWRALSLAERMANVGSEVGRAIAWRHRNREVARLALERALELLDLTMQTVVDSPPRLRELTRTREVLVDSFLFDNQYGSSDALWARTFDAWAYAAALRRAAR